MSDRIPALGDWLMPTDQPSLDHAGPGMVVNVLPTGRMVILARQMPPTYKVLETVHKVAELKGPMTGKLVWP